MTAFFPRTLYGADPSFTPLFRLLDDFDSYAKEVQGAQENTNNGGRQHRHHRVRTTTPRFDVRETDAAYELHGELPGIERENVHIEFTEPQTLVIRGRVERTYTSGTPPAAAVEDAQSKAAISEAGEESSSNTPTSSHHATVSDEETEQAKAQGNADQEVAKTDEPTAPAAPAAAPAPKEKYWVSERSVGEFSRTFNFPGRVDQEGVSANLQNGILHVVVPKAKKLESRRIAIN